MRIKERKRDGIAILELSGKLMGGPDSETFDETDDAWLGVVQLRFNF